MNIINISIDELINISCKKKIVCFGSGKIFSKFCRRFKEKNIENYIHCILDNNGQKNNSHINVNDKEIPINTVKEFLSNNSEDFFLVITCADLESIINQLSSIPDFDDIDCGVANFIIYEYNKNIEKNHFYPESFHITDKPVIPKVIHYCWFGKNPIPDKYKEWMSSWKKYCPDYEIVEWNESNYDITKNEFMYEAYKEKKWGVVPDFARLDIIYNHGGIYLDTDVELIRNLDDLRYQEAFAGIDYTHLVSLGLGFGAVPKHNFIGMLMKFYEKKSFDVNNLIAAPTDTMEEYSSRGFKMNGDFQVIEGMTVYPEKVLSAKDNLTGIIAPSKYSFSIHHYDGSWTDEIKKQKIRYQQELFSKIEKNMKYHT